jgi:hypothetical protein
MGVFTVAAINMDLLLGILAVVGWIIAQSMSNKKNPSPPRPPPVPPPAGQGEPINPNEELRRFFEHLERGLTNGEEPDQQTVRRPPPPLPQRRATARVVARQAAAPTPDATQFTPPYPDAVMGPAPAVPTHPERQPERPLHKWATGYRQRDTLRRMIVASEVLGPPLALRKPGVLHITGL